MFTDFDPEQTPLKQRHQLLLGSVGPRPIALLSTVDGAGRSNLAPFSFFGAFGSNPSVIAVSPSLRGRDATAKDSLRNALDTGDLTISAVSWSMARQMNIASGEYAPGIDEFEKSGLTKLPGMRVKPPGVAESPAVLECRLERHVAVGDGPASSNLLIARVVLFRMRDDVMDAEGGIDPARMDQVARMGFDWYTRASAGLFRMTQPTRLLPMGFDALPPWLVHSRVLTGHHLAALASLPARPQLTEARMRVAGQERGSEEVVHERIRKLIDDDAIEDAWALVEAVESVPPPSRESGSWMG